ncbi:MAG: putative tail fiber-like protein, partial [Prokaryotic dsDNA virus sp.]
MANYNLTNQTISSSFEQLVQHDNSTNILYDGTGSAIHNLEVTASLATTASYAENVVDPTWDNITNKPSGLVSGSSQIILQDTTGDLSGSRINGQVASALSASHAEFADSALSASHAEHSDTTQEVIINVKNTSGGPLSIGTPLYATGVTGDNINVSAADYNSSSTMPAIAVLQQALSNNQTGEATVTGKLIGVDTSGFTAGRNIYVTNGSFTDTRPTGSGVLVQNIGVVGKVNASEGEIVVQGSGRTNDLPNIQDGYLWVGNTNGVAEAVATSSISTQVDTGSLATTGSNVFNGSQVVSGSVSINDTNVPLEGLKISNALGTGTIQFIPAGDLVSTFNASS